MDKIKVAAVSYLNTKPLLWGIKNHPVYQQIELIEDYPSKIAQLLIDGEVDLGLIPVAAIPRLEHPLIVSDFCIGAVGAVDSVCLFSEVPIEEVKEVYLDYQSRTSVALAKLLLKEYWKKDVLFINAEGEDFRNKIKGEKAGVVIGDRALEQRLHSTYIYDLGEKWKDLTGYPFVFAAWVANKPLPESFISEFNKANALGLSNLDLVMEENPYTTFNLKHYYTQSISYRLTPDKRAGLRLFLEKLKNGS